ncbi:MAG: bifunctional adenosylcobinamide kinase/adenosylcobinamide-phosphate guanylyltransferase [Thermodesulfobacteriota bacterium]
MKKFTFILGGARSGKSDFALRHAESLNLRGKTPVFLATAKMLDIEMKKRIAEHKKKRPKRWKTIEEPVNIESEIKKAGEGTVILVDCLTLWLSNLLDAGMNDASILREAKKTAKAGALAKADVIMVSNEVGMGLVPITEIGRRFRDLAGTVNRIMAEKADEVFYLAAGLPIKIK